jgi:hypothetical protein
VNDPRSIFEAEFNSRTLAYLPGFADDGRPVVVEVGPDAHCPAGHALLACLTNQLARAHRRIRFIADPSVPLTAPSVFGYQTFGDATVGLARAINPYIEAEIDPAIGDVSEAAIILGVGAAPHAELRLGADGFLAELGPEAQLADREASVWGAVLAACLGAAAAFHRARGLTGLPAGRFSLWEMGAHGGRDGPALPGPVDVGRVLQAGAGAVACGLGLTLSVTGAAGDWTVIDGDLVDISNLNRQALFVATDAGWPAGGSATKASIVAERLQAATAARLAFSPHWYGEDRTLVEADYDVVLALANERAVRGFLQGRQPTVLLHATTSPRWQAQVHRHIAGHDDCISCRLPAEPGVMRCTVGSVTAQGQQMDASLPFLSVAAGAMLAASLARLQHGAALDATNQAVLDLAEPQPLAEQVNRACFEPCRMRVSPQAARKVDADSRWMALHE